VDSGSSQTQNDDAMRTCRGIRTVPETDNPRCKKTLSCIASPLAVSRYRMDSEREMSVQDQEMMAMAVVPSLVVP